jgi:hypothetical protein
MPKTALTILAIAAQTLMVGSALAGTPPGVLVAQFFQPYAGPQLGGKPYVTPGFTIYPPGSPNLPPQLTSPAANPYPPGAQTCVAAPYTCPAPAPNTLGNACTCPTSGGYVVPGVVH